ncbi:MAG TPA: hypothetical protein VFK15_07480, partial [Burkholderiales bacterium]|nr:hypothetical protein [Burkholderiales bacterium]
MTYLEFAVASNFSFLRGASHPEELMVQAASMGLAGIGLCDRNSVAGVVRAHAANREKNLNLRYHPGARLVFADGTPDILAYPRARAAWGRLTRLLTRGNLRAAKGDCILYCDDLLEHIEGLELVVMEESSSPSPRIPLSSCFLPPRTACSLLPCGGGLGRGIEINAGDCCLPPSRRPVGADLPLKGGGEESERKPLFRLRA